MPADRDSDPGILLALQSLVRDDRDASRTVFWLDPRSVGAGPDDLYKSLRPVAVHATRFPDAASGGRPLAADHGRHDVPAAEAEPTAGRSGAGAYVHVSADRV